MMRLRHFAFAATFLLCAGLPAAASADGVSEPDATPDGFAAPEAHEGLDALLPGEIIVDLKDNASHDDIAEVGRAFGLSLRDASVESEEDKIELADVDPADVDSLLTRLEQDPHVEHAERVSLLYASFVPDDPLFESKQWHLKKVGAETAWNYTCGQGVTVAVVDTGVACFDKGPFSRGTDLGGTRCEGGWNFVNNTDAAYDDQGHGTHVAGTIAQTTNNGKGTAGLAYCATLMPVKVLNGNGSGTNVAVAQGIRFAADHGAQVINMSLGGPYPSKVLEDAVNHARAKGVVVVAAAGNSGRSVGYPAAYPGVIAVSATDSNDNIAWFSSRGPQIAIGAPGVAVTQQTICNGGKNKCEIFGTFNGTSMASPHVAGAAAMVIAMGVTEPDAVKATLQASARPKDDAKLFGAGVLDAAAATQRAWLMHLLLRVLALGALAFGVARRIKQKGGVASRGPLVLGGALLGATGLFPLAPFLGLGPHAGSFRWIVELVMRPLGEWDMVFGAGLHRFLPLANAAPALLGALLFFGVKRLRPSVGGFALGSAALLSQMAFSGDVQFAFGSVALRVFAVVNALACLWIARVALDKKA